MTVDAAGITRGRGTGERVGIFGGTFDPPHVGHLVTAVNVRYELSLDRVLLVVADQPWQKVGTRDISPAEDRFAMVEAAVGDVEGLEASRIELDRGGMSYTADTLSELLAHDPTRHLYVILGSDAAVGLPGWERADEVRALSTVVVVERPGSGLGVVLDGLDRRLAVAQTLHGPVVEVDLADPEP